jgi:hypothetical protein
VEVKIKLENCIKRAREDVSVPIHTVYKEELSDTYAKGYNMVTEIPKYENVKTRLCKDRRKGLGTEQNPEDSSKIVFSEDFYVWQITPAFFESITLTTQEKNSRVPWGRL